MSRMLFGEQGYGVHGSFSLSYYDSLSLIVAIILRLILLGRLRGRAASSASSRRSVQTKPHLCQIQPVLIDPVAGADPAKSPSVYQNQVKLTYDGETGN